MPHLLTHSSTRERKECASLGEREGDATRVYLFSFLALFLVEESIHKEVVEFSSPRGFPRIKSVSILFM
jgi:hypothetical protein